MQKFIDKWVEVIEPSVKAQIECGEPLEKRSKTGNNLVFVINDKTNLRRNTTIENVILSGKGTELPFSSFTVYDSDTEEILVIVTDEQIDSVIKSGTARVKKSVSIPGFFTLRPLIIPKQVVIDSCRIFEGEVVFWSPSSFYYDNSEKFQEWSSSRKNLRIEFEMPPEWIGETRLYVALIQTTEVARDRQSVPECTVENP